MTAPSTRPASPPAGAPADPDPADPADPAGSADRAVGGWERWLVAAAAVAGVALRAAVLAGPLGRPDADEVITGLMARRVLEGGGFPAFFWGQSYGGTIELVPVTVAVAVLGPTLAGLRAVTVAATAVDALVLWRLAAGLAPRRVARTAALALWLGPPAAVWFGGREMLFYQPTITLGLVLGLLARRERDGVGRRGPERALAVAVAVVGLWTSPFILYFVVPAAALVAAPAVERARAWARRRPGAAAAGAAGALVAVWLTCDLLWWALLAGRPGFPVIGSYGTRLAWFAGTGLPAALGFAEIMTHRWIAGPAGVAAYLVTLAVVARGWRSGGGVSSWDGAGLVAFPFLFAALPFGPDQPNLRYLVFVTPFVAVALARAVTAPRAAAVALVLVGAVTVVGLVRLVDVSEHGPPAGPTRVGNVGELGPALDALRRAGVDHVYGDYWVAYRVAFESGGAVVASPSWGLERDPAATARVRAAGRSAWVVSAGPQAGALTADLAGLGVGARVEPAGELVVVVPERPVRPEEVSVGARHA